MGMWNNKKNSGSFNKCTCPHCRGGHGFDDMVFESGKDYEFENNVQAIDFEVDNPEDIVEQYIEAVLECDDEDEVAEVINEFFDVVYNLAVKDTFLAEIEGKIMALNMMKQIQEEDYDK